MKSMFYFKFFEVSISCLRKYCLYHAVSIQLPLSQPPPPAFFFVAKLYPETTKLFPVFIYSYTPGDVTSHTGFC